MQRAANWRAIVRRNVHARNANRDIIRKCWRNYLRRGAGVGRPLGIGVNLGVAVDVAVAVGVAVALPVGVGVTTAVAVGVAVLVGVGVGVGPDCAQYLSPVFK